MPRLLAIEWDAREARVAVARTRGKEATLEQAFVIPLPQRSGADGGSATDIGLAIQEELAKRGLTRIETLVAVGRTSIELRVLTLPPAPPDEMPDLVRFQASKQFTTAGESWPLDFVPLAQETESQTVLAAAISPELVEQIRQTCATAHLETKSLVLRPFAAASLLRRKGAETRCTMLVDPLNEEADLTVLVDGHVGFVRTVRLPAAVENEEVARVLSSEIRRTIGAASNQLHGQRVERIVLCGSAADQGLLQAQLKQQTGLIVECFDPLAALPLAPEMDLARPARAGRFAPLIGMLLDAATDAPHGIDFLRPRKRPEPINNRNRDILIGVAAALVVLFFGYMQWRQYDALEVEATNLRKQAAELESKLKKMQPMLKDVAEVDEFAASDINWLDELYFLSKQFLPPEESIVSELKFNGQAKGGGQILIEGFVKQSSLIDSLERKLRDERHKVSSPTKSFDERGETYKWRFKESLAVVPEEPAERFTERTGAKSVASSSSPTAGVKGDRP